MGVTIQWQKESQFKVISSGGASFLVDAQNRQAPCPTEVLLGALGSCCATDVVMHFMERGVALHNLSNRVTYTLTEEEPRLYKSAHLHFSVAAEAVTVSEIEAAAGEALEKYCHVCLMLQPKIQITCSAEVIPLP